MKKLIFGLFLSTCLFTSIQAQVKIGENPENLHFNSVLELESTSKALVITRMSTLQMNAITPLNGAVIYNTDTRCLHYYNDTEWINLCEAENAGNINLVDNGDNTYTFTNAAGNDITFETPAFTSNHTGSGGVGFSSGIKITDDGNTVNIEVDQIHGNSILNKTIGRTKIADDAIGVDELGDTSVNTNNLIDESVTPVKIQPSATPNQVLKTNATGTNVEWGTLDATNIAGQDLTVDASLEFTGSTTGVGALLETVGISVADGGITNAKLDKTNIPLSGFGNATTDVSLGGFQINNLANPTLDDDAATKIYVDDAITTASAALAAEVARATAAENANTANITSNDTDIATNTTNITSNDTDITDLQNDKEDSANKSNDGTLADNSATDFPTEQAVKTYVDTQVAASDQVIVSTDADNDITIGTDEGAFYDDAALQTNIANNATAITTETTRATNAENAIQTDVDANETAANTAIALKEDSANKSNDGTLADNSATDFPTEQAVKTYVDNQVSAGATALALKEDTANKSPNVNLGTSNDLFPTQNAVKTYVDNQISTINTITDGNILVGDATNTAAQVAISGDATLANTGALTIENNAITSAKILDDEIVNTDINSAAAIDGSKINPTFGAQNISTTGTLATGNTTVTGTLDITGQTTINTGVNSTTLPLIRGNDGQVLTTDGAGAATWKNPTTGIPMGTAGSIFFSDGAGNLAENNTELFWDNTNNRLGIGTDSPSHKLQVIGVIRSGGYQNSRGSSGTPSYRFENNLSTGMYLADDNGILGFSAENKEGILIDGTGVTTNTIIKGSLEIENELTDATGSSGTAGQVLTSTATGTEWSNLFSPFALGKMNTNNITKGHNITTVDNIGTGNYRVNFATNASSANYVIQLTLLNAGADVSIEVVNQTNTGFEVQISQMVVTSTYRDPIPPATEPTVTSTISSNPIDSDWFFTVTDF
ncbi:hypothetical protein Q4599_14100 [Cellulophaga lytica]|uniref:beta strand repeat-containing protein n=1 Tax=Cellulophaga lytica TaxID=979 RepID=UPI0026E4387D|nr:hypothetical protein [Cellulophaga lytica]MDO6854722.1 hypothetical protein [Cellulophaga lytica]